LRIVDNGSSDLAVFDYNYDGMRITKSGNDGEVRFVYDERAVLLETDAGGSTVAKYSYGDNLLSLSHVDQGTQFYLFAGLGSVSNLTNADGSVRCSYQYDAWGNFRNDCNASWNKKTFTGKEWDEETGLYYFGARFYDPEVGRFTTQDLYLGDMNTPPSLHRYLYAYANPTVYVDLYGNDSLRWEIDQAATRAARQGGFLGITKLVGLVAGQTLYKAANFLTVGWIDKHDDARDAYDRGKISRVEYVQRSGKAAVKSAAVIAATALTGGAGAVVAKGFGATAQVIVGGATAGLGAQAAEDAWRGKLSSGSTYLRAGLMGGALSFAGSKAVKLKKFLGDAGVREGLKKLRSAARWKSRSGGEIVGASWHETVKQPPLKQRALNQVKEKAEAAASWVSNIPNRIRNLPGTIRALPRRLNLMSKMEPGAGTYKRILEIEEGLSVAPGDLFMSGAKYRGTEGLNPAEVYEFMRNVSNRGFGKFMWSKAEMHTRVLFQRARNLAQNLLRREAVRPVKRGSGDDAYLKGDYDVISSDPRFQGQKGDFVTTRNEYARLGNEAAGIELFDVYTSNPYPHGILPTKLPKDFLIENLPGKSLQTIDLFRKGGWIRKPSKGDPWVDARFVIKMTK
jgi:RHS repeat-associated protein